MTEIKPNDVLDFWLRETPSQKWFAVDPEFDKQIRSRFEATWRLGCAGQLAGWEAEPNGALALIILFDQFPRNMFRGTADAFASDESPATSQNAPSPSAKTSKRRRRYGTSSICRSSIRRIWQTKKPACSS